MLFLFFLPIIILIIGVVYFFIQVCIIKKEKKSQNNSIIKKENNDFDKKFCLKYANKTRGSVRLNKGYFKTMSDIKIAEKKILFP